MKYEYLKGSEKDFEGAPGWATECVWNDKGSESFCYWLNPKTKMIFNPGFHKVLEGWNGEYGYRNYIKAERRPITEPVWDVSTPPPVGIECEALFTSEGSVFERARILHVGDDGIVGRWLTGDSAGGLFDYMYIPHDYRPIRSPEDVARDEAVAAMFCKVPQDKVAGKDLREAIYDAIAAGKIPGITLSGK